MTFTVYFFTIIPMDYFGRIQKSLDFIEQNLTSNISLEQISREAYSSLSHFHRVFAYMTGYTIKEYIRKRRMSCAARELLCSKKKVIDIAFDYQYQTHETFTRAFKKMYGLSPSQFRVKQKEHILFEKISVFDDDYQNLYYDPSIAVRFVTYNEIKLMGIKIETSLENNRSAVDIPALWETFHKNAIHERIPGKVNPEVYYGLYTNLDYYNNFSFVICSQVESLDSIPDGMFGKTLPATSYAVFTAKGPLPEKLINTWRYIYANWFPNSDYERNKSDDFERYDERSHDPENPSVDIYIPIK